MNYVYQYSEPHNIKVMFCRMCYNMCYLMTSMIEINLIV